MKTRFLSIVFLTLMSSVLSVCAATFTWVEVGDPGNAANANAYSYGAVGYKYSIMKYEVTVAQYVEFLNAKAKTDPNHLYEDQMSTDPDHPSVIKTGTYPNGPFTYKAISLFANNPINFVKISDACRFCNWVHNGQGSGDTEDGAYTMSAGNPPVRNLNARVWIPTVDEWHKAAYYSPAKPGGAGYYNYATQSDVAPTSVRAPSTLANAANYYNDDLIDTNLINAGYAMNFSKTYVSGSPYVSKVGSYPNSKSYYGTLDQSGNVMEIIDYRTSFGFATTFTFYMGGSFNSTRTSSIVKPGVINYSIAIDSADGISSFIGDALVDESGIRMAGLEMPQILTGPVSVTKNEGDPVSFSVTVSGPDLSFQWYRNGVAISAAANPSAQTSTLSIASAVGATQAGSYTCKIFNITGSDTSAPATLTMFTVPPGNKSVNQSTITKPTTASLTFTVAGNIAAPPATIQWKKGGVDIPIGTLPTAQSKTLVIPNPQPADEGDYSVVFTNSEGSATSSAGHLTVVVAPTITTHPVSQIIEMGLPVTFTAAASGTNGTMQWYKGSAKVGASTVATSSTLTLPAVKISDFGAYKLVTTNTAGTATTNLANLVVVDTTTTVKHVLKEQSTATLTAVYGGTTTGASPSVTGFQWNHNGMPVSNSVSPDTHITGATTAKLVIKPPLLAGDAGVYTCTITPAVGAPIDSASQTIIITNAPPEITIPLTFTDAMVGDSYTFQILANAGDPITPATFAAAPLPAGLKLDPKTGIISGTPTTASAVDKVYAVKVTATNPSGTSLPVISNLTVKAIPAGAIGNFSILVPRNTGLNADLGGEVTITSTTSGSYSGKVVIGSSTYAFKGGKLNIGIGSPAVSTNQVTVLRKGKSNLTLNWAINTTTDLLDSGSIEDTGDPLNNVNLTQGWRYKWNKTTTKADAFTGLYNTGIEVDTPVMPTTPEGVGYASFTVSVDGKLTLVGKNPDGAAISRATFVGPNGEISIFQPFYTNKGSLLGPIKITSAGFAPVAPAIVGYLDSTVSDYGSLLSWQKAATTSPARTYNAAITTTTMHITGAKYTAPDVGFNIFNSNASDTANLTFTGAGTAANVGTTIRSPDALAIPLSVKNVATITGNLAKTVLTIDGTKGTFKGSFTLSEPGVAPAIITRKSIAFSGIIVRPGTGVAPSLGSGIGVGFGYFLLPDLTPTITTSPILSGEVHLAP